MKVSVVINTLNRCEDLQRTLSSLALQRYRGFEVIVVNGPSTDRTPEVLAAWSGLVKVRDCPDANLSMSRNIGIAAAAGDVVAFIDDDAIPEPLWLEKIVEGYSAADVGGVGGWVHDATGYDYQTKYILCDRFAMARTDITVNPSATFNCPGTTEYCSLLGTNSSFRRSLLAAMGGFDEEFAYYLDETDVCLRLVDQGYRVVFVETARVLHKFAPSDMRNTRKVLRNRYEVIKNQCYFSFLHGAPAEGYVKALSAVQQFVAKHRDDVKWCVGAGLLDKEADERFEDEAERGVQDGLSNALSGKTKRRPRAYFAAPEPFLPFPAKGVTEAALTIVLLSQSYPPGYVDGIGRFTAELAAGLAKLGHEVHVITSSAGGNRVDMEDAVWVHRISPVADAGRDEDIPGGVWAKSAAAAQEIERIAETASIDVIQAPGWDAEGIVALRRVKSEAVLITSLHTPMMVAASTHPNWLTDCERMQRDILPIMRLERELFLFSDGIYANSRDVISTIQKHYTLTFETVGIVPHGMRDRLAWPDAVAAVPAPKERFRILFVGRLESRKGIDVVLAAMPEIFASLPQAEIWLIGQDHTEDVNGESTVASFWRKAASQPWFSRVRFLGKVEQEFLDEYYAQADLVIMPSRYESFGLVLLEAMMHGLPVVAAGVGGMREVVADGETGILVPAGEVGPFAAAVIDLGLNRQRRERFGVAGRRRFEEKFTDTVMAEQSVALYRGIVAAKRAGELVEKRVALPENFPLSRPWRLSDFWCDSPLRSWAAAEWFFPAVPVWISLLAREAMFRNNSESEPRVLVIGSSEPQGLVEGCFPNAVYVGRQDLPNRGIWADSEVPKRDFNLLGLRAQSFTLVLVLKPLPEASAQLLEALASLAALVQLSGVLAVVMPSTIAEDAVSLLRDLGFSTKELEAAQLSTLAALGEPHSLVVKRTAIPNKLLGPAPGLVQRVPPMMIDQQEVRFP